MLGILLGFCLRNIKISIVTTQECSRYLEVIITRERTSQKIAKVSFCISSTKMSQRKSLLIVSMRQYWKYTDGFSVEPKHQIKIEASILKNKFLRQSITNNHRAQQTAKANSKHAQQNAQAQGRPINIESR